MASLLNIPQNDFSTQMDAVCMPIHVHLDLVLPKLCSQKFFNILWLFADLSIIDQVKCTFQVSFFTMVFHIMGKKWHNYRTKLLSFP